MDLDEAMVEAAAMAMRNRALIDHGELWATVDARDFARAALAAALSVGEVQDERIDGEIRHGDNPWQPNRQVRTVRTFPDGSVLTSPWREVDHVSD